MFDRDKYKEIWQTITRNKLRSFLTGFGVAWGIFMFVIMMGIGTGFFNGIQQNIDGISQNSVFVFPGTTTMEYKGFNAGRTWELSISDIEMLKKNIPQIQYISGTVYSYFGGKAMRGERSEDYGFRGVDDNFSKMEKATVLQGREFNRLDVLEKRKVCLIGKYVYEQLFEKDEDPIGKQLCVNGLYYNVVGVVLGSDNMNLAGRKLNETVLIPINTMQQVNGMGQDIHSLSIVVYDDVNVTKIEQDIKDLLKSVHNIAPQDDAAINMFNLQQMFLIFRYLFLGIQILIWIVGMGTLLAGIVGISNIMLVSVRERTNEIGIRRALGAKPNVIMKQIMGESITLTFIAGYAGFFLAVLILAIIDKVSQSNESGESMFADPQISFPMAIAALTVLIVFGLLAGIIPARNALKIKAIDAIRDE